MLAGATADSNAPPAMGVHAAPDGAKRGDAMLDFRPNPSSQMPLDLTTVAIVLESDFGARLHELASRMPVWIVDTPGNRSSIESEWARRRRDGAERELSVFRMIEGLSPNDHVVALLRTIEAAHGAAVQDPPFATLLVYGASPDATVTAALDALGGGVPEATDDGFRATIKRAPR